MIPPPTINACVTESTEITFLCIYFDIGNTGRRLGEKYCFKFSDILI